MTVAADAVPLWVMRAMVLGLVLVGCSNVVVTAEDTDVLGVAGATAAAGASVRAVEQSTQALVGSAGANPVTAASSVQPTSVAQAGASQTVTLTTGGASTATTSMPAGSGGTSVVVLAGAAGSTQRTFATGGAPASGGTSTTGGTSTATGGAPQTSQSTTQPPGIAGAPGYACPPEAEKLKRYDSLTWGWGGSIGRCVAWVEGASSDAKVPGCWFMISGSTTTEIIFSSGSCKTIVFVTEDMTRRKCLHWDNKAGDVEQEFTRVVGPIVPAWSRHWMITAFDCSVDCSTFGL